MGFLYKNTATYANTHNDIEWWKPNDVITNTKESHFEVFLYATPQRNTAPATPAFIPFVAYANVENAAKNTRYETNVLDGNILRHAIYVPKKYNAANNVKYKSLGTPEEANSDVMLSNKRFSQ